MTTTCWCFSRSQLHRHLAEYVADGPDATRARRQEEVAAAIALLDSAAFSKARQEVAGDPPKDPPAGFSS